MVAKKFKNSTESVRKKSLQLHPVDSRKLESKTIDTLLDFLRKGDLEGFRGSLALYIASANKLRFSKKTGLGRQTLYDILDPSKGFNPALSTVTAIMRGVVPGLVEN